MILTTLSMLNQHIGQTVIVQARLTGLKPLMPFSDPHYRVIQVSDCATNQLLHVWARNPVFEYLDLLSVKEYPALEVVCLPVNLDDRLFIKVADVYAISSANIHNAAQIVPKLFVPSAARKSLGLMISTINSLQSHALRQLVNDTFSDHRVMNTFVRCGASWSHHHSWPGGLLTHSMEVGQLAAMNALALQHSRLSVEATFVAGLLHDLGKVIIHGGAKIHAGSSLMSTNATHEVLTVELVQPVLTKLRATHQYEAGLVAHLLDRFAFARNKKATDVIIEDLVRHADCLSTINQCGRQLCDGVWLGRMTESITAANDD